MDELDQRLKKLEDYVTHHEEDIKNNSKKIESNAGALALLHTINSNSNKYFVIWIITFFALLLSIGFNIYLLTQYEKVETTETIQDIDQDTDEGSNYYVGGDYNG